MIMVIQIICIDMNTIQVELINDPDNMFKQNYQLIDSEDFDTEEFKIERIDINNA